VRYPNLKRQPAGQPARRTAAPRALCADARSAGGPLLVAASAQAYYEPGEAVLSPASGPVTHLLFVRAAVSGRSGLADTGGGFEYEAGDLFPVSAAMAARAVTATYTANDDTFCLMLPAGGDAATGADSAPFADFLNRRVLQFLELSRRAVQVAMRQQALAEQSLEAPLGNLVRRAAAGGAPRRRWPRRCTPCTSGASARCWSPTSPGRRWAS
jgi:hypothetical protein